MVSHNQYTDDDKLTNNLCFCEYNNEFGERSHLMQLCCNCDAFDLIFDKIIKCETVPKELKKSMLRTIGDRLRYPYCDGYGARVINTQTSLPPTLIVLLILIASCGPIATLISFFVLMPSLIYAVSLYYNDFDRLRQTQFFVSWSTSSLIILVCVFELEVVPYLEIMFYENFILILLIAIALFSVIVIRKSDTQTLALTNNCDHSNYNCWINASVRHNGGYCILYYVSVILTIIALIYGSQLTLTTICHSTLVLDSILIPDDCGEVYMDIHMAICFVSSLYALQIAICLTVSLVSRLKCLCGKTKYDYSELKREDC